MILITGANGLVGSFLCREFVQEGLKVRALVRAHSDCSLLEDIKSNIEFIKGDVLDIGSLKDAMNGVDFVVHAAAIISFWNKKKEEMYRVNIEGTANVVNTALESGIKKLIHISSVAAIGRKKNVLNIDEESKWEESSLNTVYATTKHLAELEVYRGIEEGLQSVIVNPSVILGPGINGTSSVRLFEYVKNKNKFYTEGYMNYIDIRDLSKAVFLLLNDRESEGKYILNAGYISYKDFFTSVARRLQSPAPYIKAKSWMRELVWRTESIKSFFSGKEPLITKETARNSGARFEYSSRKLMNLTNLSFRPFEETIKWTCDSLYSNK